MRFMSSLKIGARIYFIVLASILASAAIAGTMYVLAVDNVYSMREKNLTDVVDLAVSKLDQLNTRVEAGEISLDAAKAEARDFISTLRYDNGNYLFAFDYDAVVVAHGTKPSRVGANQMDLQDPNGVYFYRDMIDVARTNGGGIVMYSTARAGTNGGPDTLIPKMSFSRNFPQWGWVIATGTYIEDLHAVIATLRNSALIVFGVGILLLSLLSVAIARSVTKPIQGLNTRMRAMSDGDIAAPIPFIEKRDEIGEMAASVQSFQHGLQRTAELEEANARARREQEEARLQAEAEREARLAREAAMEREAQEREAQEAAEREHMRELAEAERTAHAEQQKVVVDALGQALKHLSQGDLTSTIATPFYGAYEVIRTDFNAAVASLREALSTVIYNAGAIRSETSQISTASNELSHRTERQAATLEETAAAMNELVASVKEASKNASEANVMSKDARHNATKGSEIATLAVDAMDAIRVSSEEISKISSVIEDIAFQTNLLALNAGVEAARAGETGRGFAVVATEVRALAQRSSEAAGEINDLIEKSGQHVATGVKFVKETGGALSSILASIKDISGRVEDIATSAAEQASTLVEINSAVIDLDQVTQHNAAMFEETNAATHSLRREVDALSDAVSVFNLGTPEAQAARQTAA
ncbi:methyl-accepting chemotaxis sensory transducer with Cache sensor [Rhodobacter aestuarii]|uniref:Methyl-accepting chemotaxis sensory transducer with Cache sensor n=2 Tax=Rhodobacter aestuarii TaxID=453582 RepID=A0A1N7NXJ7_9RHOB|nr:methyl-accepting chemotaxis sensory transducer with Cache sensor [Rhodobacter aestuarii]SIT03008.1 methyl-accepting chemotaxis sensory transducer with Cache sensor [Rhodobacter aestuarii]